MRVPDLACAGPVRVAGLFGHPIDENQFLTEAQRTRSTKRVFFSVKQACKNLQRKQDYFPPHSRKRMNKGFGPIDCLWEHLRIPVPTPHGAPAGRSVASATSVLSGLAFDFDFLSVSVPLW